jgi:putative peptidoglycan lipid II flippase
MTTSREDTYSQIGKAGLIIIALTFIDKILAVAKEMAIASRFGVSSSLDVFNIAFAFPGILLLLSSGAIISAFVPLYLEWSKRLPRPEADARALALFCCCGLLFAGLAAGSYLLAPFFMPLLGPGFGPGELLLGIELERWLVFLILLEGTGIILNGLLYANKRFAALYTAPLFVNIAVIGFLLFQSQLGIQSLVWGFLAGSLMRLCYLIPVVRLSGFRFFNRPQFDRASGIVFLGLAVPMLGSELIANSNILVDQIMATQLSSGSVSTLRYAYRLNDLPIQLVVMAFSRAIFPFVSERALENDLEGLRDLYRNSLVLLALLTLPIICLVVLFSREAVSLLLQRGAFDQIATNQTAETLRYYSYGLFFYGYTFVNGVFFVALKQTSTLFRMGCLSLVLNVSLNFLFMKFMGVKGIALSTTVTLGILSIGFVLLLKRRLRITTLAGHFKNLRGIALAAGIAFGFGWLCKMSGQAFGVHESANMIIGVALALSTYLLSLRLVGGNAWFSCVSMFAPRWRR